MVEQHELVERVKAYDPKFDEALLNRAYDFSKNAHGDQTSDPGALYFSHPVEVADILTNYRLDHNSIITALLHDTLEDTDTTEDDIRDNFGDEIAHLVDGVTKLTRCELQSNKDQTGRELPQVLVLATSRDIARVAGQAGRPPAQHAHHPARRRKSERRQRIARETMDIYAPLAERIGMQRHQGRAGRPRLRRAQSRCARSDPAPTDLPARRRRQPGPNGSSVSLNRVMRQEGIDTPSLGPGKVALFDLAQMQRKQVEFEQLSDIIAFRIVIYDDVS